VQFKHENMSLWYGESDTPAPDKIVQPGKEIPVYAGVKPIDPSNEVEVRYRVNDGPIKTLAAKWLKNNPSRQAQYFRAWLPPFRDGDEVKYGVFCRCAGEKLPATEDERQLLSSFRVAETEHVKRREASPDKGKRNGKPINEASQQAALKPMGGSPVSESSLRPKPRAQHETTFVSSAQTDQITSTLEETAASTPSNDQDGKNGKPVPYQSTYDDKSLEVEFSETDEDYETLPYNLEPPEKSFQIKGKLFGGTGDKFTGHRVVVSFRQEATMQDEEAAKTIWVSAEEQAQVSADGSFTLLLPDKSKLESALAIKVLAPDGEILRHEELSHAELHDGLHLEVEEKKRRKIARRDGRERREQQKKFSGRVYDRNDKHKVANKQVYLLACAKEDPAPKEFQIVFAARTDGQGYFFGKYPHGKFAEAYGVVVVGEQEKTAIGLRKDGTFPQNVILVIEMPETKTADEDCSCKALVPRHPDSEDLVSASETYSVDIGSNGCVNFTAPNRTLEEFSFYTVVRSTDPEIKGFYQPEPGKLPDKLREKLAGLGKGEAARKAKEKLLRDYRKTQMAEFESQQKKHPGRGLLNAGNPVDWENEVPGFYQATTIAHGHLLHFKQIWKADGYSLGDLLYSLPLAPCQKKQIAIVDWQRREKNEREERQRAGDEMEAQLSRDRDISEIVKSALSEESEGGSSASTGSIGGGASGFLGGALLGVSGGYSTSSSEAWQDSARNLAASSLQQLSDKTKQSASSLRSQRSTVVQTTGQREDVEVTTEVIANHNHCHAMTVEYFEVLRHFCVEQQLAEVQECLFVPLLMSRFDFAKAQRWRDTLSRFLRKDKLKKAFPAINRILDNYRGSDLPKGRYAEESIQYLDGQLSISFELVRPPDNEKGEFVPANWRRVMPFLDAGLQRMFNQFMNTTEPEEQSGGGFFDSLLSAGAAVMTAGASLALQHMYGSQDSGEELTYQQARDLIFEKELAPRIAQGILESIEFVFVGTNSISPDQSVKIFQSGTTSSIFGMEIPAPVSGTAHKSGETQVSLDPTLISKYVTGKPLHVRLQPGAPPPPVAREDITFFEMRLSEELPAFARVIIHSGSLHYRTEHLDHFLFKSSRIENLLSNDSPALINTPLDSEEERNPRAEDRQIAHELIEHLNEHLVFYHLRLFRNMHRQHLYMLLDGFEIGVFDGERRTRRSLASVIENRMIGIAGNSLIFPVAQGYHLDPTFEVEGNEAVDLFSHYAPTTPIPPMRISVPTPGVYAEAVMGKCNSCEVKDGSRFWRWEESPCGDEPTAIQAPSTESRRAEPPNLAPTPLAQPIISMQTAPEAPAPTGLASAMQLLGTPNLFKDITGLDLNQQNAMSALSATLETAKSFGNMALQLEQQKLANQAQLEQQRLANQAQSAQQNAGSSNLDNQALSRDSGVGPTTANGNDAPITEESSEDIYSSNEVELNTEATDTSETTTEGISNESKQNLIDAQHSGISGLINESELDNQPVDKAETVIEGVSKESLQNLIDDQSTGISGLTNVSSQKQLIKEDCRPLPFMNGEACLSIYDLGGDKNGLFVKNTSYDYVTIELEIDLVNKNTKSSKQPIRGGGRGPEVHRILISPRTAQEVLFIELTKKDPQRGDFGVNKYAYQTFYGNPTVKPDGALYELPFPKGKSYTCIQGFNDPRTHDGKKAFSVDFDLKIGDNITAAREGIVVEVKTDAPTNGNTRDPKLAGKENRVIVRHKDGTYAMYSHLMQNGSSLKPGAQVKAGDLIGKSGNSGFSSVAHLHFDVEVADGGGGHKTVPWKFKDAQGRGFEPINQKSYSH